MRWCEVFVKQVALSEEKKVRELWLATVGNREERVKDDLARVKMTHVGGRKVWPLRRIIHRKKNKTEI